MDENKTEDLAKKRFIEDGSAITVLNTPQCVTCKHNTGFNGCDVFEVKPENYLFNNETCPKYEEE